MRDSLRAASVSALVLVLGLSSFGPAAAADPGDFEVWFSWDAPQWPPRAGDVVSFTAGAGGYDSDPVTFEWDFGDGQSGEGWEVDHTFTGAAEYTVTATATDGAGQVGRRTERVSVLDATMPVWFDWSTDKWPERAEHTLWFHGHVWDYESEPLTYRWDFGDGGTGEDTPAEHIFAEPGTYAVALTVTDGNGNTRSFTRSVELVEADHNEPPHPWIEGPTKGRPDQVLAFRAGAWDDGEIVAWDWDFGDGSTTEGEYVEHAYTELGSFTVTLVATDDQGATGTAQQEVQIRPPGLVDVDVDAADLGTALTASAGLVSGARYEALPPTGTPNGVARAPLAGFPTAGESFAILTSGDATLADEPDDSGSDGVALGGESIRGDTDYDVTILALDLQVPVGANCLTLDFRFLSEEYPEWVGSPYNDAFIAELDKSTWTTEGSRIEAPDNFAFDQAGDVVSINASGVAEMTPEEAAGTTYDGATPLLRASTPVTPGTHTLYLSIFDQGDMVLDSAVFIDNLAARTVIDDCDAGIIVVDDLEVNVAMDKPSFGLTEQAAGAVSVVGSKSREPIADVDVTVTVDYRSGDPVVDEVLTETDCATWSTQIVTGEDGSASFQVPQAVASRCAGLPGLLELPSEPLGGSYSVHAHASHLLGDGEAATTYMVGLL